MRYTYPASALQERLDGRIDWDELHFANGVAVHQVRYASDFHAMLRSDGLDPADEPAADPGSVLTLSRARPQDPRPRPPTMIALPAGPALSPEETTFRWLAQPYGLLDECAAALGDTFTLRF